MEKALRNVTHTLKQTHSCPHQNALSHLYKLQRLFLAVIPEAIVDPEAQQFQRWLGAKEIISWHVEIIQEAQQALPTHWHKHTFGSLLYTAFHNGLDVIRRGLEGKKKSKNQKSNRSYLATLSIQSRSVLFTETQQFPYLCRLMMMMTFKYSTEKF